MKRDRLSGLPLEIVLVVAAVLACVLAVSFRLAG